MKQAPITARGQSIKSFRLVGLLPLIFESVKIFLGWLFAPLPTGILGGKDITMSIIMSNLKYKIKIV